MDKLILNPEGIRGLGNILPSKSSSDFRNYQCKVSSSTDTVNGESMTVFSLSALNGAILEINSGNFFSSASSFNVSCKLKKGSTAIGSASVTCIVNDTNVLTGNTNSSGNVTFSIPVEVGVVSYFIEVAYAGTSSVAGCASYIHVNCGDITNFDLDSDKEIMQIGDVIDLIADVELDGISDVNGLNVDFIEKQKFRYGDNGTNADNTNIWELSNTTLSRENGYSVVTAINDSLAKSIVFSQDYLFSDGDIVEFDFKLSNGSKTYGCIYIRDHTSSSSFGNFSLSDMGKETDEWVHIKLVPKGNTLYVYADGSDTLVQRSLSNTDDAGYRLMFYSGKTQNPTFYFRNLRVSHDEIVSTVKTSHGKAIATVEANQNGFTEYSAKVNNITSECDVYDVFMYDEGTLKNKNESWYNYSNRASINVTNECTRITGETVQQSYYYALKNGVTDASARYAYTDFIIECDILGYGANNDGFVFYDGSTRQDIYFHNIDVTEESHVKIAFYGSLFRIFVDGEEKTSIPCTFNSLISLGFLARPNSFVEYRNFMIYQL
ncbi:hypothetical protein [uncultured Methanobrevibacter sp.]|uniref:hypothetical protein n=1 Tax=uncultured Methanobrevibacter sp. TaxID=253161 RepID=UPI0025E1230A|nr:hypothetical protein [uncultured Methanobrevibacter sp.]